MHAEEWLVNVTFMLGALFISFILITTPHVPPTPHPSSPSSLCPQTAPGILLQSAALHNPNNLTGKAEERRAQEEEEKRRMQRNADHPYKRLSCLLEKGL